MASRTSRVIDRDDGLTTRASSVIAAAQRELSSLPGDQDGFERSLVVVELAVRELDRLSRRLDCSDRANRWLIDWRDRLGSYLHAARALADVRIDTDVARHLLQRGVDEVGAAVELTRWNTALSRY
jgi:hypothetical protein